VLNPFQGCVTAGYGKREFDERIPITIVCQQLDGIGHRGDGCSWGDVDANVCGDVDRISTHCSGGVIDEPPLCLQRVEVQAALRPNNGQPTIRSFTDPPQTVTAKCPQSYGRVRTLHRLEVDERTWY
jgi:hypothetical protein